LKTHQHESKSPPNCINERIISQQAEAIAKNFPTSLVTTANFARFGFSVLDEKYIYDEYEDITSNAQVVVDKMPDRAYDPDIHPIPTTGVLNPSLACNCQKKIYP
jgi:hypothetical protein